MALSLTAGSACNRPYIARTWVYETKQINEISKIHIHYNCGEKPIKAYDPLSAALWIIKAYTRCARTECTWGRAKGNTYKDGTIRATFDTFMAKRHIQVIEEGKLLRLDLQVDYRDPKTPSETKTYYLRPAE